MCDADIEVGLNLLPYGRRHDAAGKVREALKLLKKDNEEEEDPDVVSHKPEAERI
jgi:hypothetical protein